MSVKPYEIETFRKVFDNENGASIKIGPDTDGLGLIEIDGGEDFGRGVRVSPEMALVLAEAIKRAAQEMLG